MKPLKESCVDEGEPLRSPESRSPDLSESRLSSSASQRKPGGRARHCILFLLVVAVLICLTFVAFIAGQWINEQNTNRTRTTHEFGQQLIYLVTPLDTVTTETTPTILTTPARNHTDTVTSTTSGPRIVERLIPLEPSPRNISLLDVFPPSMESYEFLEELHATRVGQPDYLLVPLPPHVVPLHYELLLDITRFAEDMIIRANLSIQLESYGNSTDDEIMFHIGPKVNIERIRIRREGKRVYPKTIKREDNKKLARLILRERLQKGKYYLDIEYNTTICSDDGGVHCYSTIGANGTNIVTSFTTKFEPALARSFMPCWDEPSIKATFNVSVMHHARYTVLSNMPLVEGASGTESADGQTPANRIVTSYFQETPPMSTYLLAFAVGDFVPFEMRTERNIPVTIWTHREDFLLARFAANFSPVMFDRHEEELEVPYPLPKMDFVAARAFPVGGMENWGLVVFDHQSLLMDQAMEDNVNMTVDRLYQEYRIEKIITHELSHQWFGNLVTMNDWSDLWLNEGFATYFVLDFLQNEHPKLTENEYFTRLARLVRKQSGPEPYPLVKELRSEADVEKSFHATHLYTKGCVVVRMIRDLVSDFDFRSGVKRYLRKNAYKGVSRQSLWASLPAHADHGADHERLDDVMEGWILNEGLPEVTVTRSYESDMIRVEQQPASEQRHRMFLVDGAKMEMAGRRSGRGVEETTPFDENLFDDMPHGWRTQLDRQKHNRKRKKGPRPPPPRPSPDVLIESRREELRHPRRAREPSDLWSIPFSYMFGSVKSTEGQVVRQFWLKNRSISFADVELAASQPLLANPDWSYPYRVNYDHTNWKMLARLLHQNHLEVPSRSRMQLIVDAETFLSQGDLPHLYIYILGYLSSESDLGVALVGLDAVFRLADAWRGSSVATPLLLYLSPVVAQFDRLLDESQTDTELAALWLVEPTRLSQLYQLRCATNLQSCDQDEQTRIWSSSPMTTSHDDVHRQVTGVCHYMFTNNAEKQGALLEQQLKSRGTSWSTAVQLAACASNDRLARLAAKQIVATKNAAIFASSLQSDFSLHYNERFRRALWSQMGRLSMEERRLLFSPIEVQPASKILIHSVRSTEELRQVRSLLPTWEGGMGLHLEFIERLSRWKDAMAGGVLKDFFNGDTFI